MANLLGKRYRCAKCGTEILCTKAGTGEMICCEEPMKTQEAKAIPSSDYCWYLTKIEPGSVSSVIFPAIS